MAEVEIEVPSDNEKSQHQSNREQESTDQHECKVAEVAIPSQNVHDNDISDVELDIETSQQHVSTDQEECNASEVAIPSQNENSQKESNDHDNDISDVELDIETGQQVSTDQEECNVSEVKVDIPSENESSQEESDDEDEIPKIIVPSVTELWNVQQRSWVMLGLFVVVCIVGYFTTNIGKARNEKTL
jgi:hypothetical protein